MAACLLVVEDAFLVSGLGLVVTPDPEGLDATDKRVPVELRRPDGSRLSVVAVVRTPHLRPRDVSSAASRPRQLLAFEELTKDDIPVGTTIWKIA